VNPFALITDPVSGQIGLDPGICFGFAGRMIAAQRRIKSGAELAIIQTATTASHSMQRAVQCKSAQGITTYGMPYEKV
jgi:Xaa-Pro dipeptidase